jgi:hypothetical protein
METNEMEAETEAPQEATERAILENIVRLKRHHPSLSDKEGIRVLRNAGNDIKKASAILSNKRPVVIEDNELVGSPADEATQSERSSSNPLKRKAPDFS